MIRVDKKTDKLIIEKMLLVGSEETLIEAKDYKFTNLKGLAIQDMFFVNCATWVEPNKFQKLLMKVGLFPKMIIYIKRYNNPERNKNDQL